MNLKAIVFDLDDTLYPETDYVKSGFRAVGNEIEKRFGVKDAYEKLCRYFSVDKNDVYNRVLRDSNVVFTQSDIADLVGIYRTHKPEIALSEKVKDTLLSLRKNGYKIGIITDGRPVQQRAKIEALGLEKLVHSIIVTDELGGTEFRKPNPTAFETMCKHFQIQPQEMLYVGDNPNKDFAIKKHLPVKTVQIKSGLYQGESYLGNIRPDIVIQALSELTEIDFNDVR